MSNGKQIKRLKILYALLPKLSHGGKQAREIIEKDLIFTDIFLSTKT